jgi:hypothetical protein
MGKRIVTFDFDVRDPIQIKAAGLRGRIECLARDFKGSQYQISYWRDGQRIIAWVYGDEIELITADTPERLGE